MLRGEPNKIPNTVGDVSPTTITIVLHIIGSLLQLGVHKLEALSTSSYKVSSMLYLAIMQACCHMVKRKQRFATKNNIVRGKGSGRVDSTVQCKLSSR